MSIESAFDEANCCYRCSSNLEKESTKSMEVCEVCFDVVGPRPGKNNYVCYLCGMDWVIGNNNICKECLLSLDVTTMYV